MRRNRTALVSVASLSSLAIALMIAFEIWEPPFHAPTALALAMIAYLLVPLLLLRNRFEPARFAGALRVTTTDSPQGKADMVARVGGSFAWLVFAFLAPTSEVFFGLLAFLFGSAAGMLAFFTLLSRLAQPLGSDRALALEGATMTIVAEGGSRVVAYADIQDIEIDANRIVLVLPAERHEIVVSGDLDRVKSIARAIEEAKAKSARRTEEEAAGPRALVRHPGTPRREWLGRIDALAETARGAAYRAVGIDEEHLWKLLADEDAEIDARAAAARVLSRSAPDDSGRVRVRASTGKITDPQVRARVEAALTPDAEQAAAEMEVLETVAEAKKFKLG